MCQSDGDGNTDSLIDKGLTDWNMTNRKLKTDDKEGDVCMQEPARKKTTNGKCLIYECGQK